MYQLQQIRDELRMGASFLRPGSYVHTTRVRPTPGQGDAASRDAAPPTPAGQQHTINDSQRPLQSTAVQGSCNDVDGRLWKPDAQGGEWHKQEGSISIVEDNATSERVGHQSMGGGSQGAGLEGRPEASGEVHPNGIRLGVEALHRVPAGASGLEGEGPRGGVSPLPVSAASLGLTEPRGDGPPSGADIVVDALVEERLAKLAQKYVENEVGGGVS